MVEDLFNIPIISREDYTEIIPVLVEYSSNKLEALKNGGSPKGLK